jgi:NAD+ kinase
MLEGRQIPILGVNMGSLGFLTEIRIEDLYKAIISTLQHKNEFKVRSMLSVQVKRGGRVTQEYVALNDAVIERGSNTHLINIEVFSENQLVATVKADALVVATPTGSTAYNLAAGGPILHPDVHAIVMTPVCPHALTSRPLIFPDDQKLSFKLVTQDKRVVLTVDGVNRGEVTHKDEIVITRSKIDHFVIRKPSSNYFTLLREKLAFGQRA